MTVTLELPEDIVAHLAAQGENVPRVALEALALQEYRTGKLSQAQLRRLLGYETRMEVDGFLKRHGVELEYTLEDLERDRETHRRIGI
jgi:hypothetical protein